MGSGACRALGQTGDSLSSLCDRRWWPKHSSHRRGPCRWLGARAGPQGPRCAIASQQAAYIRRPWPQPCPGGARQAQGQPAPCHLCLRLPVASPTTSRPTCPAPGCLPLEAHDLQGPARPAWPPHRERAEGLAWTRATLAQRALPPAAPGVQPFLNKVSSRNPERRPHDGCWGARPRPQGGVVPMGLGNRQTGLAGRARAAVQAGLQAELWSRPSSCPRHTVPTGVSRWPGRSERSAAHWSAATGPGSGMLCCHVLPRPPPLASLRRAVWQGCLRGHPAASGPGKRPCKGPEAGVSLLREQLGPSQEGMSGRPGAGPLCGFGLKQMVTMPSA